MSIRSKKKYRFYGFISSLSILNGIINKKGRLFASVRRFVRSAQSSPIKKKKPTSRLGSNMDYSRSISVPADKARPVTAQKKISEPSIASNLPSSPEIDTMPNTPSTDEMDGSDTLLNRRSSSGGLLSPEVDMPNVPRCSIDGPEHDGFYLLKKDSQRRLTLSRVLEQDSEKICSKWMLSIHQDFGTTVLTMNHLEMLRCALKEYIMDQNRSVIEQAIITLKEELDFDSNAINELHSAIYMFQEAVNAVLRMHSIKPHWMFALDNLVRNAVQAAITVLSPELGANLAGQEGRRSGVAAADTSPSALSSTNSARDTHALHALRHENHKLLQELIESYQLNQTLLRQVLEEQKSQMMIFKEFVEKKSRSCTPEVFVSQSDSAVDTGDGSDCVDEGEALRLREWVAARGLPSAVTNALLSHCYVLTDLLQHAQREDIAKLNLKGGIELRLWRAIQEHRLHNSPPPLRRSSSTEPDDDGPLLLVEGRARPRRAVSTASACSSNPTIVIRDQVNGDDSVAPYYGDGLNL